MRHCVLKLTLWVTLVASLVVGRCSAGRQLQVIPETFPLPQEDGSLPESATSCSEGFNCSEITSVTTDLAVNNPREPVVGSLEKTAATVVGGAWQAKKPGKPVIPSPGNPVGKPPPVGDPPIITTDLDCLPDKQHPHAGIYDPACWNTAMMELGIVTCTEQATNNRLLRSLFKGVKGNNFVKGDPVANAMPAVLQPTGYNLRLTVDGMLMAYLTTDVSQAYSAFSKATPLVAEKLWAHVEALGGMPGSFASGAALRTIDRAIISGWVSFTVDTGDSRRHFIVFSGEINPSNPMANLVEVNTEAAFPGLAKHYPSTTAIPSFHAPANWWIDGYPQMKFDVLTNVDQERTKAGAAGKCLEVFVAGISRGSGMAMYMSLDLMAKGIVPSGVYLFSPEKPGDQNFIKLYTQLDNYDDTCSMRTHVWGNREDVFSMYPPRTKDECAAVTRVLAQKGCDKDTATERGAPPGFHSLPPEFWWRLTAASPNYADTTVYCLSGKMLAYRYGSQPSAAVDGFVHTLTDKEVDYQPQLVARWVCPWLPATVTQDQIKECYKSLSLDDHNWILWNLWTTGRTAQELLFTAYPEGTLWDMACISKVMLRCLKLCPY